MIWLAFFLGVLWLLLFALVAYVNTLTRELERLQGQLRLLTAVVTALQVEGEARGETRLLGRLGLRERVSERVQ